MATKFFVVENSEAEQRLIEATSKKAVERYLTKEFLSNYSIAKVSMHEMAGLIAKGIKVEEAFEPEDPAITESIE